MRILALDHGTVRVGVAVSDELGIIATPLEFIAAEPWPAFLVRLQELIREKEAGLLLVGMPRNMDGSHGPAAEKVRQFVAELQAVVTVPIKLVDERLSSVQAQRVLRESGRTSKQQRGRVDQTAAAILLQSYLDNLS